MSIEANSDEIYDTTPCAVESYIGYLLEASQQIVDPFDEGKPLKGIQKSTIQGYEIVVEAIRKTTIPKCTTCPNYVEGQPIAAKCPVQADIIANIKSHKTGIVSGRIKVRHAVRFLTRARIKADILEYQAIRNSLSGEQ
ncbi:MAG: hypothetical protein ABSB12_03315 [Candidatus Saccharimonadales bacterium]|jgi:hypothetical protein